MKASETQIAGQHYKDFPIQPAEFCQRNRLNWCEANVVKYVARHRDKKGAEDIRKAIHYLELLLEWEYPQLDELYLHGTLCDTCARPDCAKGEYPATKDGGCEGYIPNLRERLLDAKQGICANYNGATCFDCRLCPHFVAAAKQDAPTTADPPAPHTDPAVNCKDCGDKTCSGYGINITRDYGCVSFQPKEAARHELADFTLPTITICCTPRQIMEKLEEEISEYVETEPDSMARLIEAWDCIQVAQTLMEHDVECESEEVGKIRANLHVWHGQGRPVMQAKRAMLVKNAARAMYSDHVNAAILATL